VKRFRFFCIKGYEYYKVLDKPCVLAYFFQEYAPEEWMREELTEEEYDNRSQH
jgi:hypothetical protein